MKRIRLYRIPDEILIELLTGEARLRLPKGAVLEGTWRDVEHDGIILRIRHESFRPVLEGQAIEVGALIVERWTALPS